ncbi:MAG: sigma-70 family RNA polymerase sigma factor [Candidatus Eremiobacteraeota bacterium]|nr:sigma-70 family RNA polymerase sigma factor [Candidatus Eremiobacteraeota bacterium]
MSAAASAQNSDHELIARTLAGEGEAFGVLVERYERAVYNLALRTMRDGEEAKDATQEAFFKAFRALRTFKPGSKFSTWIFAIAYHACCDRLAKRARFSGEELPERADPQPGPAAEAERRDEARRLRDAIDSLPDKYRAVITLYHLQGKQYDEIATVLELPMGTVKTHLFRAKELLRKRLNDESDEDEDPAGAGGDGLRATHLKKVVTA